MNPSPRPLSLLVALSILAATVLGAPRAHAEPTAEEVKAIAARLDEARKVLARQGDQLQDSDRALLSARMLDAEAALTHYLTLSEQGKSRKVAERSLYMTGGVIVADDVSGVGAADDVLLPLIALGVLVAHAATKAPATASELDVAWAHVLSQVQSLAHVAATVQSKRKGPCSCVCYKKGIGPSSEGQSPSPMACAKKCVDQLRYDGYRCGGSVTWM